MGAWSENKGVAVGNPMQWSLLLEESYKRPPGLVKQRMLKNGSAQKLYYTELY